MEVLFSSLAWGTPLGIGLFFFFSCSGAGILFWGLSHLIKSNYEYVVPYKDKSKNENTG